MHIRMGMPDISYLADLPESARHNLYRSLSVRVLKKGEVVFKKGDLASEMYIVVSGSYRNHGDESFAASRGSLIGSSEECSGYVRSPRHWSEPNQKAPKAPASNQSVASKGDAVELDEERNFSQMAVWNELSLKVENAIDAYHALMEKGNAEVWLERCELKRKDTCEAVEDGVLMSLRFERCEFLDRIEDIYRARKHLKHLNAVRDLPLFKSWTATEVKRLAKATVACEVKKGDTIAYQGRAAYYLFFIMEGSINLINETHLIKHKRVPVLPHTWDVIDIPEDHTYKVGCRTDYFGEEALCEQRVSHVNSAICASESAMLLMVPREVFLDIVTPEHLLEFRNR
jgi:CRP-like cAMP-binding protein